MNLPLLFVLIITLAFSCREENTIGFTDVTNDAGIDFRYNFGDLTYENILESSGSGVSVLDYNGDGFMDIYLLNGTYLEGVSDIEGSQFRNTPDRLYQNNGDGTFTDVTSEAGIGDLLWSCAAAIADYDYDGDDDIYLLNYGPNIFYSNNGDGTFTDVTDKLGLHGPDSLNDFVKWSVGAAFMDFNKDGLLDLMQGNFLAFDPNYVSPSNPGMMPHPSEYRGQASLFYVQDKEGKFTEVTNSLGLFFPDAKCMGLTVFDFDQDTDLDIFQGNDHQPNFMFRNEGTGVFSEVAVPAGMAVNDLGKPTGSMHGTPADFNGDGLIDLLVTDLEHGSYYKNSGNGLYEDCSTSSGIAKTFIDKGTWGAAAVDFDNDGDVDIFAATGTAEELIEQLPVLLENDGNGNFQDAGAKWGDYFKVKRSGRGAAVLDYNNDGKLDIIVSHVDLKATATLLKNSSNNGNVWLGLSLIGKNGKASAFGAKITITACGKNQVRICQPGVSYLSYNDPRIHFGLGKCKKVEQVEILWPDGQIQKLQDVSINQYLTVKEPSN